MPVTMDNNQAPNVPAPEHTKLIVSSQVSCHDLDYSATGEFPALASASMTVRQFPVI